LVRPATVAEVAPAAALAVAVPGLDVTVKPVMALPPLDPGVQTTVTSASPAVTLTMVGAAGSLSTMTEFDAVDGVLVAAPLVAVAVNV